MTGLNYKPLVSVCMMTFNHAKYISYAIDSVLSQQSEFDIELVIGEDFSTDGTREIVLEYQQKFPKKVRITDSKENLGMVSNFLHTLSLCKGKYIALLEGDDQWIDNSKLKMQIDFLEQNTDYSISCHNALVSYEHIKKADHPFNKKIKSLTLIDLIWDWHIPTASIVFCRNKLIIPEWFSKIKNWDYAVQLLVAKNGKIHYIDDIKSIYRKHPAGNSYNPSFSAITTLNRHIELFDYYKIGAPEYCRVEIDQRQVQLKKEIKRTNWINNHRFLYRLNPLYLIRRTIDHIKYLL